MKRRKNAFLSRRTLLEFLEPRRLLAPLVEPRYSLTELEPFPSAEYASGATAINNASQIVGAAWYGFERLALLWNAPSTPQFLGILPELHDSTAVSISSDGTVLGLSSNFDPWTLIHEPWLWSETSGIRTLEETPFNKRILMNDLNATQTVGYQSSMFGSDAAVIWDAAGGLRLIPVGSSSSATAINASGQVVGSSREGAFIWDQQSAPRFLGALPGGEQSAAANDISDSGYVVGGSRVERGIHAFRWHSSTGMQDLGELPGGVVHAYGNAVNNFGQVVGVSANEVDARAFYWDPTTGLKELNALIDLDGYILTEATDINDLGQIVANGRNPQGAERGFLLTPLNQPPILDPIENQEAGVGQPVRFTVTATDLDDDNLTYVLDAGAPAGAAIDPVTGEFSFTPSASQAGQTYSIRIQVVDNGMPQLSDAETFSITIEPELALSTVSGPAVGVPGQLRTYSATFTDPDSVGGYSATINWGDGVTDSGVLSTRTTGAVITGVVSFWHTYTSSGDRNVRLTLRDRQGNQRTSEQPITVQFVTFQPDSFDSAKRSLVVGGFNGPDQIAFSPEGSGVRLTFNGYSQGRFDFDGSIVAFGQAGNDTITAQSLITRPAMFFGQDGDDVLIGGAASDLLNGGAGNDTLAGNAGRDLLFGGLGADLLFGHGLDGVTSGADDDLLCSDYYVYEYDQARLASLQRRWTSATVYTARLHNLRYEQDPVLNNSTLFNDFSLDRLAGGNGRDWFAFLGTDLLLDPESGEEGLGVAL